MKIALASDLHLEFGDIKLVNQEQADVLILGGDICVAQDLHDHPRGSVNPLVPLGRRQEAAERYREFFDAVTKEFKHIVYVMGNHEHYHGKFDLSLDYLKAELAYDNLHILEKGLVQIEGVAFLGATLWTNMNNADSLTLYHLEQMMNDFRTVRLAKQEFKKFLPKHAFSDHHNALQYFKLVLENIDRAVVCTHHAPSFMSIHEMYKDDQIMNGGYASDLSEFILDHPQIKLWTHGHVHTPFDYTIGDTRVVCNPRGYVGHEPAANNYDLQYIEI